MGGQVGQAFQPDVRAAEPLFVRQESLTYGVELENAPPPNRGIFGHFVANSRNGTKN
jgi:hypothetical protein